MNPRNKFNYLPEYILSPSLQNLYIADRIRNCLFQLQGESNPHIGHRLELISNGGSKGN